MAIPLAQTLEEEIPFPEPPLINSHLNRLPARGQQALQYAELLRLVEQRLTSQSIDRLSGHSSRREAHDLRPQVRQRGLPARAHEPPAPRGVGDEGPACERRGGALPLGELPLAPRGHQAAPQAVPGAARPLTTRCRGARLAEAPCPHPHRPRRLWCSSRLAPALSRWLGARPRRSCSAGRSELSHCPWGWRRRRRWRPARSWVERATGLEASSPCLGVSQP
eukprot:scaffold32008_cov63-Phaeocystis_antarctica.AAC.2